MYYKLYTHDFEVLYHEVNEISQEYTTNPDVTEVLSQNSNQSAGCLPQERKPSNDAKRISVTQLWAPDILSELAVWENREVWS